LRAWELHFGAGLLSVQKATLGSGACILDQPQPEVPEEIAAAAADAPEQESGNETEVEWGGSLTSYSSYEVCEIPDLETARQEAEAVAQTKWLEQRRLQAPPLYAAGVAGEHRTVIRRQQRPSS